MEKFTSLTESFFFYGGTVELRFDVQDHKYYKVEELGNLTEVKGVTNTVHIIDRSVALTPWAAKKCAEKIIRTIPLATDNPLMLAPISLADFTKLVMEAKNAHREILVEAGDIGHLAHKCLEDSIQFAIEHTDGIVLELKNIPEEEKAANAARAAFAWMQQHKVKWLKTEQKIYSKKHNYAGTMDGSAMVSSCDDRSCCAKPFVNHRSLIDWKSSNYLYIEYLFQTASYLAAEVEEYGIEFDDRWILRLGKNEEEAGKFEPWFCDASTFAEDFSGFLACLALTNLVDSVTERISVQKKGVREIKKQQRIEQKEIAKMKAKVEKAAAKAQLKLDRAAEKERIKAEAKKNREEMKNAAKRRTENSPNNDVEESTTIGAETSKVPCETSIRQSLEGIPITANEVSGSSKIEVMLNESLPVCPSVRDVTPESPKDSSCDNAKEAGGFLEESVEERRPFVIPEVPAIFTYPPMGIQETQ